MNPKTHSTSNKRVEPKWSVREIKRHFSQYFDYSMAVSFIGGGNRRG